MPRIELTYVALVRERSGLRSALNRAHKRKRGDLVAWPLLPCFRLPIPPRPCCIDRAYSTLRRDILRYQPIQMVGGEATTTVGQRRSESPLLLQAHRLTPASPAAGPELKYAGERRFAIHATPALVKTPVG